MYYSVDMSVCGLSHVFFFFFKQKTAYEMRISDWSSDVCSSDLHAQARRGAGRFPAFGHRPHIAALDRRDAQHRHARQAAMFVKGAAGSQVDEPFVGHILEQRLQRDLVITVEREMLRSEEHTSELQSLLRSSYAVFCLKKQKRNTH